jgi:hypothetical protein
MKQTSLTIATAGPGLYEFTDRATPSCAGPASRPGF